MSSFKYGNSDLGGEGLFATVDYKQGTLITSEPPLLSTLAVPDIPNGEAVVQRQLRTDVKLLSADNFARLQVMYRRCFGNRGLREYTKKISSDPFLTPEALPDLASILARSGFNSCHGVDDKGSRLFYDVSWLNHSCNPNAELVEEDGMMHLRATREISEDEEILISYLANPFLERTKRQTTLWFVCECGVCTSPPDGELESVYNKLDTHMQTIVDFRQRFFKPEESVDMYEDLALPHRNTAALADSDCEAPSVAIAYWHATFKEKGLGHSSLAKT